MKERYVILTGGKNNAGDFLIKHRAKTLFAVLRPDREIIDYDAWKPFTPQQLETVNSSKALILMGGPALQYNMRPAIYPLVSDLSRVKVPVIMMGLGYKDPEGSWENSSNYKLSSASMELLQKVESSGYMSGVRDYHTLNFLLKKGLKNVIMTGCPALYDLNFIGKNPVYSAPIKKIAFSLGVSYLNSDNMYSLMKDAILKIKDAFRQYEFTVYFHHAINKSVPKQEAIVRWLEKNKIHYLDISGSADNLMKVYSESDMHIGFRVHSHIFSCSISKPSVLFTEDGRGKGLYTVIGGMVFNAYKPIIYTLKRRIKSKLGIKIEDTFIPYKNLPEDTICNLNYEIENDFPRMIITRKNIDAHFEMMKKFLSQLP